MNIRNTPLWDQIENLISLSASAPVDYRITATLSYGVRDIEVFNVLSLREVEDYEKSYSSVINAVFNVPTKSIYREVYPNRDNLTCKLFFEPVKVNTDLDNLGLRSFEKEFKALALLERSEELENNLTEVGDDFSEHSFDFTELHLQLVDFNSEFLEMSTVSGIYLDSNPSDLLTGLLALAINKLDLKNDLKINKVSVDVGNNETVRKQYLLPKLKPSELPHYIQDYEGGIYANGVGRFIKNRCFYVYPLYDLNRFQRKTKTLTIINIPAETLNVVENSFYYDGTELIILINTDSLSEDKTEREIMTTGSGVRFFNVRNLLDNGMVVDGQKVTINSEDNYKCIGLDRKTNLNFAPTVESTENPFKLASSLSKKKGMMVNLLWQNALPSILKPSMPVRYMYLMGDEIRVKKGVLLGIESIWNKSSDNLKIHKMTNNTTLNVFLERIE